MKKEELKWKGNIEKGRGVWPVLPKHPGIFGVSGFIYQHTLHFKPYNRSISRELIHPRNGYISWWRTGMIKLDTTRHVPSRAPGVWTVFIMAFLWLVALESLSHTVPSLAHHGTFYRTMPSTPVLKLSTQADGPGRDIRKDGRYYPRCTQFYMLL